MVIVQGKPMLWVIVADPPCILIPPPTEKRDWTHLQRCAQFRQPSVEKKSKKVARAVCGSSGSEL